MDSNKDEFVLMAQNEKDREALQEVVGTSARVIVVGSLPNGMASASSLERDFEPEQKHFELADSRRRKSKGKNRKDWEK